MNYADIIWKLVERLLDEKDTQKLTEDKDNKIEAEDQYIANHVGQ